MTPEQTIELARQAGCLRSIIGSATFTNEQLQLFYKPVRNEVLEEAAVVCERLPLKSAKACAEVIRLEKS